MATLTKIHKDDRIDIRIKHSEKDLLNYAASLRHMKLSAFVLYSAVKAAEETVGEKVHFSLSDKKWKAFCEILDRPAREIPKLKKLFQGTTLFLDQDHDVEFFDCGEEALDDYLAKYAYINNKHGSSRTYVTCKDDRVVGYYTLTVGSVSHEESPVRISKGQPRYPIPVIILARLAVDNTEKGKGLGKALLRDSILKAIQGSDIVGGRAILVHAKNVAAKEFYMKYGFEPSPVDEYHLCILLKEAKKTLGI
jgi:uncharacterized protein (DUF1778 family)/GNAT superfamily N-acetyltransferase